MMALVDIYLLDLRTALSGMTLAEREEIVDEIRAHIEERAIQSGMTVEEILRRLGPAAELARDYNNGALLLRASRSRSPWFILRHDIFLGQNRDAGARPCPRTLRLCSRFCFHALRIPETAVSSSDWLVDRVEWRNLRRPREYGGRNGDSWSLVYTGSDSDWHRVPDRNDCFSARASAKAEAVTAPRTRDTADRVESDAAMTISSKDADMDRSLVCGSP